MKRSTWLVCVWLRRDGKTINKGQQSARLFLSSQGTCGRHIPLALGYGTESPHFGGERRSMCDAVEAR